MDSDYIEELEIALAIAMAENLVLKQEIEALYEFIVGMQLNVLGELVICLN